MSKEDWIRKISSRKFWAMLAALVVCICAFFAMPDADVARITALIGAFGDLAIYMLSEALVDAANGTKTEIVSNRSTTESKTTTTALSKDLVEEQRLKSNPATTGSEQL